jgi:hypothetical protein
MSLFNQNNKGDGNTKGVRPTGPKIAKR